MHKLDWLTCSSVICGIIRTALLLDDTDVERRFLKQVQQQRCESCFFTRHPHLSGRRARYDLLRDGVVIDHAKILFETEPFRLLDDTVFDGAVCPLLRQHQFRPFISYLVQYKPQSASP
jgi:hypothetical protein